MPSDSLRGPSERARDTVEISFYLWGYPTVSLSRARSIAAYSVFPFFFVVPPMLAYVGMQQGIAPATVVPIVIAASLLGLLGLEQWIPYRTEWAPGEHARTDAACLLFGAATGKLFDVAVISSVYVLAERVTRALGTTPWPSRWPLLAQFALAVLIADLMHYVAHRLLHRVPALWSLHVMHHGPDRLYTLNFFRMHPVDIVFKTAANLVPLVLLGASEQVLALWAVVSAVSAGALNHANVDARTGMLDAVFSTPALHRWHHSSDPREGEQNFGNVTILFDRLFGTYHAPRERSVAQVGNNTARTTLRGMILGPFVRAGLWS